MRWVVPVVLMCFAAGCTPNGDAALAPFDTLPLDDASPTETIAATGDELAPSQISASTVVRPDIPDPCAIADLTLWTAQIASGSAVIRIRNDGPVWCAVDIVDSEALDPIAEPDLWLEPRDWADLVAGPRDADCDEPSVVDEVEVDVNGADLVVPTALVACEWWLTALYPTDPAEQLCSSDSLSATWVEADGALVVRNISSTSCDLSIADSSGATGSIEIVGLAPGDVTAWPALDVASATCADGPVLPFTQAVDINGAPGCTEFTGPGRPVVEVAPSLADAWADGSLDPFATTT